ncbi:hypothetical protein [Halovivax ruber]|uniref:hypothetical protein n=1 Tax=Halovivax ruber TaxID=387341 RepID=UPI001FDEEBA2|nr:hypothetical protein [Halovivax ruber]
MGSEPTDQLSWKHFSEISLGKKLALVGGGVTIAGAFLPWFSVEFLGTSVSRAGIDADGIFTLILAAIAVVVVGRSRLGSWGQKTWIGVTLIGIFVAFLALGYINDPWMGVDENPSEEAETLVNIGIGLYLTAIGGVMLLAGPLYDKYA